MIYRVNNRFYEGRPEVALVNHAVNTVGGQESSHIREDKVGRSVIELTPVSNNYNYGPADIEVLAGTEYVGNVFFNVAYNYVLEGELDDYPSTQLWSWVWCRNGIPDTRKIRRRIEDALRKSSDSVIFRVAEKVGISVH